MKNDDRSACADKIFTRLLEVYGFNQYTELSEHFGKSFNWAASTKSKGTIPFEVCLKAALETGASLDYIYFGIKLPEPAPGLKAGDINLLQSISEHLVKKNQSTT